MCGLREVIVGIIRGLFLVKHLVYVQTSPADLLLIVIAENRISVSRLRAPNPHLALILLFLVVTIHDERGNVLHIELTSNAF